MISTILITKPSLDYALLDSGEGEKLERYGKFILSRPDPQALWRKNLSEKIWQNADAIFKRAADGGVWKFNKKIPDRWQIELAGLKFWIRPTSFKHTGLFPEQSENWKWIMEQIEERKTLRKKSANASSSQPSSSIPSSPPSSSSASSSSSPQKISIINLFGYTGGATLAAAKAGAEVCHLDGSKTAITWARDNAAISSLGKKPIRWILDDARLFLKREIRRGRRYDGIIMDPPAFGHGPNKELWKIEEHFLDFLDLCQQILSDHPLFVLINGYASGYSPIAYENSLRDMTKKWPGKIEIGELTTPERSGGALLSNTRSVNNNHTPRLLPCGIFARWSTTLPAPTHDNRA